jgi:SPX domain protein involved in polyphosphate accumulation
VIEHNQSVINHAAVEYATVKEEVEKLNQYISSVRESLEKDSYQGIVEVKKELNLVADLAKVTSENLTQFSKVVEGDLGKQYTRLNDLGNKIKGLSQDPNFLQRYS